MPIITGLDFPDNATIPNGETVSFKWTDPHLNGLPVYGVGQNGLTYIWRYYPKQQAGYYTTFFWGNNDGGGTLSTFLWDGGGADSYYGAHPYPNPPPNGTAHQWEVSVEQNDYVNGTVEYNRWHIQALRVWRDASGNKHHEFYWDLPNVDAGHLTSRVSPNTWGEQNPPAPALTWGDAPWQPGNELGYGIHRGIQIYSKLLSLSDILAEIDTPQSTVDGAANIWYLNLNPTPTDISDQSGQGHHPSWVGSNRPTLFSQDTGGPNTLDTQAKRMAAVGVGRPFIRRVYPDVSKGAIWRSSVGNSLTLEQGVSSSPVVPYEAAGRSSAAVSVPDEAVRVLIQDVTPAHERVVVAGGTPIIPHESKGLCESSLSIPHEMQGILGAAATVPYATSAILLAARLGRYEGMSTVSALGVPVQEQLAALAGSVTAPWELSGSLIGSRSASVEWLILRWAVSETPLELTGTLGRAVTVLHEVWSNSLILRTADLPHEFRWHPTGSALGGHEWVAPVAIARTMHDEFGRLVKFTPDISIEARRNLISDKVPGIESLHVSALERSALFESLSKTQGGGTLAYDALARILKDLSPLWEMNPGEQIPVSILLAVPYESLAGIVGTRILPYEVRQGVKLDAIDWEWVETVVAVRGVPYEVQQGFVPRLEYGAIESEVFFPVDCEFSLYI